jgi:hypothetical protein
MDQRQSPDRELKSARFHYSIIGITIASVGAFIAIAGQLFIVGAFVVAVGALAAFVGTIAPASVCLRIARADDEYQRLKRLKADDGEI